MKSRLKSLICGTTLALAVLHGAASAEPSRVTEGTPTGVQIKMPRVFNKIPGAFL